MTGDSGCVTITSGVSVPILKKEGLYAVETAKDFVHITLEALASKARTRIMAEDQETSIMFKRNCVWLTFAFGMLCSRETEEILISYKRIESCICFIYGQQLQ
jgi:hypothetical protein